MSVSGAPDEPVRAGPPIADLVAGLYAAFGITAALVARGGGTGRGQRVEASLVNGLISMLAYFSASHLATGAAARAHRQRPPRGLALRPVPRRRRRGGGSAQHAGARPALSGGARPRPSAGRARVRRQRGARCSNREALRALIDEKIGADTVEAWIERLNRAGVPCGRVMDLGEVFADPQVRTRRWWSRSTIRATGPCA